MCEWCLICANTFLKVCGWKLEAFATGYLVNIFWIHPLLLQICVCTYQASFTHFCNIWSNLQFSCEIIRQKTSKSWCLLSKSFLNMQKCREKSRIWFETVLYKRTEFCKFHAKWRNFCGETFIFSWRYIQEYVSDLVEKWMVREVDIWSFRGVLLKMIVVKGLINVCWASWR